MVDLEMKYSRFVYSINKNVKSGIELMSAQNLNIKKNATCKAPEITLNSSFGLMKLDKKLLRRC